MKKLKRILIPLTLSVLVAALLLAGCHQVSEAPTATQTGAQETAPAPTVPTPGKTEPPEEQSAPQKLTEQGAPMEGVELENGETPPFVFQEDNRQFTGTGDGKTQVFDLEGIGSAPDTIVEVKVDGQAVQDYTYNPKTGELTLPAAPAEGAKIEVEAKDEEQPPETTEPTPPETTEPTPPPSSSEPEPTAPPTSSEIPSWTGAPETPIIPYRPPETTEEP